MAGALIHKTITQFFRDTEWGDVDYLIADYRRGPAMRWTTIGKKIICIIRKDR